MSASPLANATQTKRVLEEYGFLTKHKLGQNFLVNDTVIEKILDFSELDAQDRVLEVGPGITTLTLALLKHAGHVMSIEADKTLEDIIPQILCEYDVSPQTLDERFNLYMGDALKVPVARLQAFMPNKFISNLPYQVAATLILKYFQEIPSLQKAVVMVQKEVADRICASVKTKAYGAYTVKLGLLCKVVGRYEVAPHNFMPAPHVDSTVVCLQKQAILPDHIEYKHASRVIDTAFAQRRKTIRNSMSSSGFSKDVLDNAFAASNISPTLRAEALSQDQFIALIEALA